MPSKIVILTAPSGSGKTTLVKHLLEACPQLSFSVSACTRPPRAGEVDGRDYFFITAEKFEQLIQEDAFVEWEMVYAGKYYGTLRSNISSILESGQFPLIDIDVKGALKVKELYGEQAYSIFIKAPSLAALRNRLEKRGTETPETLEERVKKAAYELGFAEQFDYILVNDDLEIASKELVQLIKNLLEIA